MNEEPATTASAAVPDDADDLRGHYFKQLLRKPLTQALVAAAAIAGGVAGAAFVGQASAPPPSSAPSWSPC